MLVGDKKERVCRQGGAAGSGSLLGGGGEEHAWALGWEEGMKFQDLLRGLSGDKGPEGEAETQVVGLGFNPKMEDSWQ